VGFVEDDFRREGMGAPDAGESPGADFRFTASAIT
jgi:hypothetical protein